MMGAVSRPGHPAVNHQETEAVPMLMRRALTTIAALFIAITLSSAAWILATSRELARR